MKKLFIALALVGMAGSVSAATVSSFGNESAIVTFDKGKKKEKKSKKEGCCKSEGTKSCSKEGEKKGGCCKDKQKTETAAPAN